MTLPVHEANSDYEFELIEFCMMNSASVNPAGLVCCRFSL